jgi:hypothetical protein
LRDVAGGRETAGTTKIPPQGKVRLTEAVERLVQFYQTTGKKDEAAKWRGELKAFQKTAKHKAEEEP